VVSAEEAKRDEQPGPLPGPEEALASDQELLRRFRAARDPAIREELVRRFLPFARGLALRYRGGSEPTEDLIQVASLALVNAIDRFEPERGIPFTAFAAPTILGELKRHFRDRVWTLRVPRGLQERIADIEEAITKLTGENGRSPSISEIGEKLGLDDAEVLEVFEASYSRRTLSLDQPVAISDESDETSVVERIGEEDARFEVVEERTTIQDRLSVLSERERLVLRLRFVEDMTQSQIAERIGFSQMHVSRILRRALQSLREAVGEEDPPEQEKPGNPG
jgi:RNA polymerase sigma-B factor